MKATGIVRRMDDLGRVVIPEEILRTMCLQEGDELEIFIDNETGRLVLVPYISEALTKLEQLQKSWKKFRKTLDKLTKVWYNINIEKEKEVKSQCQQQYFME